LLIRRVSKKALQYW